MGAPFSYGVEYLRPASFNCFFLQISYGLDKPN